MSKVTALLGLSLVTCWPFAPRRTRGRHRVHEQHQPRGLVALRVLRLDVVAGRLRRQSRAQQWNSAPFPPEPVGRAEYFPPGRDREAEETWDDTSPLVPRWLDALAPDVTSHAYSPRKADPWE